MTTLPLLCLAPLLALAGPTAAPNPAPAPGHERPDRPDRPDRPERARVLRVVALAELLELDETQALHLGEVLRKYDERRRPIRQQVQQASQLLERAAGGDASVLGQVDAATARIFDARTQLAQLDKELFGELSKGLSPEKRARLAVGMARLERRMRQAKQLRGGFNGDGPGEDGPRRRGGGRRGQGWEQGGGDDGPDEP